MQDAPKTTYQDLTPPRIGDYWKGQGGYYAGIIRDGDRQWHLLLADSPTITAAWGDYGTELAGVFSQRDGMHNTYLILASDSENEIASHCTALLIDGHKDFYWPSQCELNLVFNNLPDHMSPEFHWSSTPVDREFATYQYGPGTSQGWTAKANRHAARAVRRILID